jgi:hypothetical protein
MYVGPPPATLSFSNVEVDGPQYFDASAVDNIGLFVPCNFGMEHSRGDFAGEFRAGLRS